MKITTIGLDIAKNVFQVHGVDSAGKVVITRQLRRKQVLDGISKQEIAISGGCSSSVQQPVPPAVLGEAACGP